MVKQFKQRFQVPSLADGMYDLTTKELKELHADLTQQLQTVEEAILSAIDRNNYTQFYDLVIERKRLLCNGDN